MKHDRKAGASKSSASEGGIWRMPEFPGADLDAFLTAQRDTAEAVAAAYRKAFEGWTRILAVQTDLARSLMQRGASLGTELYRRPGQAGAADTFAEATRAASEDIVRSTREIVDTACECCADAVKSFGEPANRAKPTAADESGHRPTA